MTNRLFCVLKKPVCWIVFIVILPAITLQAQNSSPGKVTQTTLPWCIDYALEHQPQLKEVQLNEDINESNIRIASAGWLPQVMATANVQHYVQLPVLIFPDFNNPSGPKRKVTAGVLNSSTVQLSATQNLYRTDLMFARRTAPDYRMLAAEDTKKTKIDVITEVSKGYYDVLLSDQQINVLGEDVQRLEKNTRDAYNLFQNGIADKTDYQRAVIALNNSRASWRSAKEAIRVKYAYLKQVMGYPVDSMLTVSFDSAAVADLVYIDTLQLLDYNNRIEYQTLQTNLRLRHDQVDYYKWSFLPSLSAFYTYNIVYQNDLFSDLYNARFPNSIVGLSLSLPIFQGTSRLQSLNIARLQYKQSQYESDNLKSEINTEYAQAMAQYKSNLNQLNTDGENVKNAREIYGIITLQYNHGIKTYLDVIVAETDLRTAELNYLDTLFQVLSSALDVRKAMGILSVQ